MPLNDPRIEHLVVLMLENRSFDHMLGFSGIPGIDGLTGKETNPDTGGQPVTVSTDAQYIGDLDPTPDTSCSTSTNRSFRRRISRNIAITAPAPFPTSMNRFSRTRRECRGWRTRCKAS